MGFEQDALEELSYDMFGRRSASMERFSRAGKGEQFVLKWLMYHDSATPSQLASAARSSSGRISAVLAALEEKQYITREIDPQDRRNIKVSLTELGYQRAEQNHEEMRSAIYWIFSQMGERRTREFVELSTEFATYMSICAPGEPRPTAQEVEAAFTQRAADVRALRHQRHEERAKAASARRAARRAARR